MKAILLAVVAAAVLVAGRPFPRWHELEGYSFERYYADFRRGYTGAEYDNRKAIFEENFAAIRAHNAIPTESYKKGVNQFTDWTNMEFKAYNRYKKDKNRPAPTVVHKPSKDETIPSSVDYRLNNNPRVLTAIKNQGMCGNCWAHSSVESMEAYFAMKTGQLPVLSTQQITSCCTYVNGCGGGDAAMGWVYVNTTTGLTTEWAYPFVDIFAKSMSKAATAPCKNITKEFNPFGWFNELTEVGISGSGQVSPANSASAAKSGLAKVGPMSISVAALGWKDYEAGIYHNNGNSTDDWSIDHAVQMVGYGSDAASGKDYWIVRNSWGTLWGEAGYIKLDRPATEPCDIWGSICGTSGCLNELNYPQVYEAKTKHF